MSDHPTILARTFAHTGRIRTSIFRRGRRSVVLGAVLLLGSTVAVLATNNTPPKITTATLSQSVINEGQNVTLTGTFTDPDAGDYHTVQVDWHNGPKTKVQLAPGQTSFQTNHQFTDDSGTGDHIHVTVYDRTVAPGMNPNDNHEGNGDDAWNVPLLVKNVAPTFAKGVSVTKPPNSPGVVAIDGVVVDPGTSDKVKVGVNWGNGPQLPELCTLTKSVLPLGSHSFHCDHAYPPGNFLAPKTYQIGLTVEDDDGGKGTYATSVQIP